VEEMLFWLCLLLLSQAFNIVSEEIGALSTAGLNLSGLLCCFSWESRDKVGCRFVEFSSGALLSSVCWFPFSLLNIVLHRGFQMEIVMIVGLPTKQNKLKSRTLHFIV
jgi:hypothetical protein